MLPSRTSIQTAAVSVALASFPVLTAVVHEALHLDVSAVLVLSPALRAVVVACDQLMWSHRSYLARLTSGERELAPVECALDVVWSVSRCTAESRASRTNLGGEAQARSGRRVEGAQVVDVAVGVRLELERLALRAVAERAEVRRCPSWAAYTKAMPGLSRVPDTVRQYCLLPLGWTWNAAGQAAAKAAAAASASASRALSMFGGGETSCSGESRGVPSRALCLPRRWARSYSWSAEGSD